VSSQSGVRVIATIIVAAIVVVGLVGYSYYTTSSSLASLSEQNSNLSQQLSSLDQQASNLNQQVSSGNQQISSLNQQVSSQNQQISGLNQQVSTGNQQISSLSQQVSTLSQQESSLSQQVSSLAESSTTSTSSTIGGGLYIVSVAFSGNNVTVNLGNSGGGVPTPPGYGDTGVTARFIGAIIIQYGSVYYHYNWNCQLNTSCALSPGPFRYFTLTQMTSGVNVTWNLGNSSLVPDILSVGGSLSAGMILPWTHGANYTIYLQSNDNSIVYQASFTAP
jgi:prefoldin subunit 5